MHSRGCAHVALINCTNAHASRAHVRCAKTRPAPFCSNTTDARILYNNQRDWFRCDPLALEHYLCARHSPLYGHRLLPYYIRTYMFMYVYAYAQRVCVVSDCTRTTARMPHACRCMWNIKGTSSSSSSIPAGWRHQCHSEIWYMYVLLCVCCERVIPNAVVEASCVCGLLFFVCVYVDDAGDAGAALPDALFRLYIIKYRDPAIPRTRHKAKGYAPTDWCETINYASALSL